MAYEGRPPFPSDPAYALCSPRARDAADHSPEIQTFDEAWRELCRQSKPMFKWALRHPVTAYRLGRFIWRQRNMPVNPSREHRQAMMRDFFASFGMREKDIDAIMSDIEPPELPG